MVDVLKQACDRSWDKETPVQIANIAACAIYWRNQEIAFPIVAITNPV